MFVRVRSRLSVLLLGACVLVGCRDRPPADLTPGDVVLARVGDSVITAEAFRMNYEFGHGHLRRGADPRGDYLGFMIDEALLAQEAARRGLDTARAVAEALHTLREELLIERVFETRVLAGIEVTDAEIRAAVAREAVQFRFRFLPALSRPHAEALRRRVSARGYEAVLDSLLAAHGELRAAAGGFVSPYLKADEIEPDVLAVLRDLVVGVPSAPVHWQNGWHVFEVMDVRRTPVGEDDYRQRAPTARQRLFQTKALEGGTAFVAATMEPLNVVTKRAGFEALNAALRRWYAEAPPSGNLLRELAGARGEAPYARDLARHLGAPLVTFGGATWSIRDFLAHFTPGRYVLRGDDPAAFKARLADVVALVVRDKVLLEMARQDGLEADPEVRRTLGLWRTKWLFEELARTAAAGEEAQVRAFYEAHARPPRGDYLAFERLDDDQRARLRGRMRQERLRGRADSLARTVAVEIDRALLDTLALGGSTVNPYMTVHLFKSNADKMPFPIVDPGWRLE